MKFICKLLGHNLEEKSLSFINEKSNIIEIELKNICKRCNANVSILTFINNQSLKEKEEFYQISFFPFIDFL